MTTVLSSINETIADVKYNVNILNQHMSNATYLASLIQYTVPFTSRYFSVFGTQMDSIQSSMIYMINNQLLEYAKNSILDISDNYN